MRKGEVIADRSTLLKFADELGRRFGPQLTASLDTVTADLGRFENSVFSAQLALAQGFIPGLRDALQSFNDFSKSTEGRLFFTEIGVTIGKFISVLAEVPKYFNLIKAAVQGFIAVKLAGFMIEGVRHIGEMRMAIVGLSQSMAFIGPQMQQMSMAQRVLGQGFAQVVGWIDVYRASLLRSTAATNTARLGNVAFAGTLGVVRTAMVMTAGAARALWLAFGGLPGVIATGITIAVGSWLTSVGDATTALTEHERQIELVKNAYHAAGGELEGWAEKIEGVTLTEAEKNLNDLMSEYDKKIQQLQNRAKGIRTIYDRLNSDRGGEIRTAEGDGFADAIIQIVNLIDALEAGSKTVAEFRSELNGIAQKSANDRIKEAASELLEFTRQADEGQSSLTNLGSAMQRQAKLVAGLRGKTSALKEIVGENTDANNDNAESYDRGAAIKTYTEAIDNLKGKIPSLTKEMKHLKDMTELNTLAWQGMVAAFNAGDLAAAAQILDLLRLGREELTTGNTNFEAKYTAERGTPQGAQMAELVRATTALAEKMGVSAKDLLTVMSYETGGTLDPWMAGPTTQWGQHRGLIQWGEPQAAKYGVNGDSSITAQVEAAGKYLADAGVKTGDGLLQIYAAINAGDATRIHASDAGNGAAPGTVLDKVNHQMGGHQARADGLLATYAAIVEETVKQTQAEIAGGQATEERIAQTEFAIAQQQLINAGKGQQAAVEAVIAAARAENPNITAQEIQQLTLLTEQEYALKNAVDEKKAAEDQVNQLYQLRQQLLEQLKMAQENGDQTQAVNLRSRIVEVNGQLDGAIHRAIAMWQAMGGPEADAAIAKLQTTAMSIQNAGREMTFLGLSLQQWDQVGNSFADGLVGTFDALAQAIADGTNAVESWGKAFLQVIASILREIAQLILKKMLLNALGGIFPGIGAVGHTGGVVGSKAIGGGNARIGQSAPWMRSALTYHTGGIAGFKPDEVNATLKIGEEILTEENPRHRNNLGGEESVGASASRGIKQVLVLDPKDLSNAMASRAGEEVVVTHIKNNVATIRQMLR